MTTEDQTLAHDRNWTRDISIGVVGGLVGGVAFGGLMAMMDMLPMVGMLAGREDAVVGFGVHMLISAVIGAIYGALFGGAAPARQPVGGAAVGLAYGFLWWILGPLLIMPTMMGMGPSLGLHSTR